VKYSSGRQNLLMSIVVTCDDDRGDLGLEIGRRFGNAVINVLPFVIR
jgi:hypothetical protein